MRVIPPITITNSILTSSNIAEPSGSDPALWSEITAYTVGNLVRVEGTTHKIYECLINVTGGESPELDITRITPKWAEVRSVNRWAMFDLLRNTASESTDDIIVVLTPGVSIDSIAVLGMSNITTLYITATSGGTQVYERLFSLNKRTTYSWYEYFFGGFYTGGAALAFDLPTQYSNLIITIIASGTGTRGIGSCVIGNSTYLGRLQNGATVDALNFSTIDRDIFGTAILVPRRNVPKTNQRLYIDKSSLYELHDLKFNLDAVPAVWSGMGDEITNDYFDPLVILGIFRSFVFQIDNPIGPMIELELEEI